MENKEIDLKYLRHKSGYTRKELADEIGVAYTTLYYIEKRIKLPSLRTALLMSKALKTPVEKLFPKALVKKNKPKSKKPVGV